MSCCGGREKEWDVKPAQKWDYINLSDFKSSGCFTPFTYGFLWIMLGVSVACYIADFSTMINLLLWNKFGANGITPPAPFGIEAIPRWVFTGCIILSYILLVYRWWKAIRAMKSGGVAKSYLDPLAARIQSVRMGKEGRGFRRFLVFAELTKSKHGTEYIALFVYFAFEAWLRIIFAEGPRNVINGYTIYHLITTWADVNQSPDTNKHDSAIQKFWAAALAQANNNHIQAAVFLGMVFTIIVWVIAFVGLVIAFIMYVIFLWHHIPQQDGGLRGYCKRKVDKSVEKIVSAKIKQALEDEQKQKKKSHKHKGPLPEPQDLKRQPTLPVFMDEESGELPPYATRPGTPSSALDKAPTLPDMGNNFSRPGMPRRTGTGVSGGSYGSDAPLLGNAADVGFGEPGRPYSPGPGRPYSPANGRSASPAPPPRPFTPTGELVMDRAGSPGPGGRPFTPANGAMPPFAPGGRPGPPGRANTGFSNASSGGRSSPGPGQMRTLTPANGSMGPRPTPPPGTPGPGGLNPMARTGSAQSAPTYRGPGTPMQPPPRSNTSGPGGMMPPPRSNTAGPNGMQPPPRSNTAGPNGMQPPPRSNTAAPYAMQPPPRSNTAGPYAMQQGRQSPASFSRPNPYGQRTSGQSNGAVQEYEMQPQARGGPPSATGSDAYQAYRPGGGSGTPGPQMGRPPQQPPQGGHPGSYAGDSIFDHYS